MHLIIGSFPLAGTMRKKEAHQMKNFHFQIWPSLYAKHDYGKGEIVRVSNSIRVEGDKCRDYLSKLNESNFNKV